jgi:multiple sugar transport system substrate-binding protein
MHGREGGARRPTRRRRSVFSTGGLLAASALTASAALGAGASTTARPGATGAHRLDASAGCKSGATKITFWAWAPGYNQVVSAFDSSHPQICVTLDDVGTANVEYTKITSALKAGSGFPDVAEIEYIELPSLEVTHSLVNLVPYGIDSYKSDVVPSAWAEVSQGSAVYAMPGDIGPMGFYYNSRLLAKYHITPPTTWAQFASDAATLHKQDSSAYLANFDPDDVEWLLAMMQAYGAFPFAYGGGSKVTIDFTGAKQMAFAKYWDGLLSAHEVNAIPDFTPAFWNDLDDGTDASWLMAAWGPGYMAPNMKKSVGDWRAAPMPQLSAGGTTEGSWGGSTAAVIAGTKNAKQAAEFAEYFFGDTTAWKLHADAVGQAFPGYKPLLDSSSFTSSTIPLSGSSHPESVFAKEAANISSVQWPPIMQYVLTDGGTTFAGTLKGSATLTSEFQSFQKALTSYATSEGLTVSS